MFGSSKWTPPTKLAINESTKTQTDDERISEKERKFNETRLNSSQSEIKTSVNNRLKAAIEQNLDPKKSMSEYVRKNAIRDVQEKLDNLMNRDDRFKAIVKNLWKAATKADFSKESLDRISSAHLIKAKSLLLPVIKAARNEALKGMSLSKKSKETDETEESESETRESAPKKSGGNKIKIASDIPKGMTTAEFLAQD